jgi:hypothetical protein
MPLNPDLKAKLDSATEHYEALLASEHDRATWLLASMIVDETDPGKSIAASCPCKTNLITSQ